MCLKNYSIGIECWWSNLVALVVCLDCWNLVLPKYLQFAFYAERFYQLFANHGLLDVKKCVFKCWAFAAKVYIGIKWLKEMMLTDLRYIYIYIKSLLINVPYKYSFIYINIYINVIIIVCSLVQIYFWHVNNQ